MNNKQLRQLRWLPGEIVQLREQLAALPDIPEFAEQRMMLTRRLEQCRKDYNDGMAYLEAVPDSFLRQILKLHFADGLSYRHICRIVGGGNTYDGIRKQCYRYLRKHLRLPETD